MGNVTISNVLSTKLKIIPNKNGDIFRVLKNSEKCFRCFGEAYFSQIKFNKIKAWKRHKRMTCNLIVPKGEVKFVFTDDLKNIKEEIIGESNYSRLTIPPGIWFGFQGCKFPDSIVLNIADIQHEPLESEKINIDKMAYSWGEVK